MRSLGAVVTAFLVLGLAPLLAACEAEDPLGEVRQRVGEASQRLGEALLEEGTQTPSPGEAAAPTAGAQPRWSVAEPIRVSG